MLSRNRSGQNICSFCVKEEQEFMDHEVMRSAGSSFVRERSKFSLRMNKSAQNFLKNSRGYEQMDNTREPNVFSRNYKPVTKISPSRVMAYVEQQRIYNQPDRILNSPSRMIKSPVRIINSPSKIYPSLSTQQPLLYSYKESAPRKRVISFTYQPSLQLTIKKPAQSFLSCQGDETRKRLLSLAYNKQNPYVNTFIQPVRIHNKNLYRNLPPRSPQPTIKTIISPTSSPKRLKSSQRLQIFTHKSFISHTSHLEPLQPRMEQSIIINNFFNPTQLQKKDMLEYIQGGFTHHNLQ